jgi:integrase
MKEVQLGRLAEPLSWAVQPSKKLFHFQQIAVDSGLPVRYLGCPFFPRGGGARELVNRYLRDRWTNSWSPRASDEDDAKSGSSTPKASDPFAFQKKGRKLVLGSIDQVARNVDRFIEWWEATIQIDEDWEERLSELGEKIIDDYGDDLESGRATADGGGLATNSIRARQIDALQFLRWAKHNGMAPSFVLTVVEKQVRVSSFSGAVEHKIRRSHPVVRRQDPRRVLFPTTQEVRDHLRGIPDPAHQVAAALVYGCGLRASEAIRVRLSDLQQGKRGAGGIQFLRVKGKGGVTRDVEIGAELVRLMRYFDEAERPIRLMGQPGHSRPPELLVREDGSALDYRSFYRGFRRGTAFSPHLGRHWHAVNFLLTAWTLLKAEAIATGNSFRHDDPKFELQIDLIRLKENLGHAQIETTYGYLVALGQQLQPYSLNEAFQDLIDG